MLQSFEDLKSEQVALLLFIITLPILFVCRIPYFVEGDTIFYAVRMDLFVEGWDVFLPRAMAMVKHLLYLIVLGTFKIATPFLRAEDTIALFSTFFSSLNIGLTYYLCEKWLNDRRIALVSVGVLLCTRWFLYYTLLGEQYTFQAFFMLVILLLIHERKYIWSGIVLGLSLIASPACGYLTPAYLYLIWNKEKNLGDLSKLVIPPTIIFAPILFCFREWYGKNIEFTLYVFFSQKIMTGIKLTMSDVLDNFLFLLPLLFIGYIVSIKRYRKYGMFFTIAFISVSLMVIGVATPKWYLTIMPLFAICIALFFKEYGNFKIMPILMLLNIAVISSMLLVPLYHESIDQHDIFLTGFPKPLIMRWSSGMMYQYYTTGPDDAYLEIMAVCKDDYDRGYKFSLPRVFESHDKVYLYDYFEIQCRAESTVYGLVKLTLFPRSHFGCLERILRVYPDVNYKIYREFDDGTIIWELTQK